jgi:hypothetical protein
VSFKKKKTSRKIAGGMAEAVEVKFARVKPWVQTPKKKKLNTVYTCM